MQAIIETLFDSIYLTGVMILGLLMSQKSQWKINNNLLFWYYGYRLRSW
mgnify:CR=1 FL=1